MFKSIFFFHFEESGFVPRLVNIEILFQLLPHLHPLSHGHWLFSYSLPRLRQFLQVVTCPICCTVCQNFQIRTDTVFSLSNPRVQYEIYGQLIQFIFLFNNAPLSREGTCSETDMLAPSSVCESVSVISPGNSASPCLEGEQKVPDGPCEGVKTGKERKKKQTSQKTWRREARKVWRNAKQ